MVGWHNSLHQGVGKVTIIIIIGIIHLGLGSIHHPPPPGVFRLFNLGSINWAQLFHLETHHLGQFTHPPTQRPAKVTHTHPPQCLGFGLALGWGKHSSNPHCLPTNHQLNLTHPIIMGSKCSTAHNVWGPGWGGTCLLKVNAWVWVTYPLEGTNAQKQYPPPKTHHINKHETMNEQGHHIHTLSPNTHSPKAWQHMGMNVTHHPI